MRLTHEFHCKDLLDASSWEDEAPALLAGSNIVSVGAFGEAAWHVAACLSPCMCVAVYGLSELYDRTQDGAGTFVRSTLAAVPPESCFVVADPGMAWIEWPRR